MSKNHDPEDKLLKVTEGVYTLLKELLDTNRQILHGQRLLLQVAQSSDGFLSEISQELQPQTLTASVVDRFSGDSPMANGALVFNVGQTSIDTITPLLADGVTPSGGTVSAVVITFSDASATFVLNPDNTVTYTAVVASIGGTPVSGTRACTVTDTDGVVSQWTAPFTVLVNAVVPPEQLTQSVVDSFSTPTP